MALVHRTSQAATGGLLCFALYPVFRTALTDDFPVHESPTLLLQIGPKVGPRFLIRAPCRIRLRLLSVSI